MVRYASWKHGILLLSNSVGIPDCVFECVKLCLHERDHDNGKKHPVGHQKKKKIHCRGFKLVALKPLF